MNHETMVALVQRALDEDLGAVGDATSHALLPTGTKARLSMLSRQSLIVAGLPWAEAAFRALAPNAVITPVAKDGDALTAGAPLLHVEGDAAPLLAAERTALNLVQRASAVATATRAFVDAVAGTGAVILDTRKTMPGLRELDKYGVRVGGGENHRMGLWDMILIKDNHIALCGGTYAALERAREGNPRHLPMVVECDTVAQLGEVLAWSAEHPDNVKRVLLDNMPLDTLRQAVEFTAGALPLEASGNMSLEHVRDVAETGVQYISVGRITHSAPSVDIGLDVVLG